MTACSKRNVIADLARSIKQGNRITLDPEAITTLPHASRVDLRTGSGAPEARSRARHLLLATRIARGQRWGRIHGPQLVMSRLDGTVIRPALTRNVDFSQPGRRKLAEASAGASKRLKLQVTQRGLAQVHLSFLAVTLSSAEKPAEIALDDLPDRRTCYILGVTHDFGLTRSCLP
ncbi:hypothetical protein F5144DRAFT_241653 [Chaetomium tenue]|uniref:Uncharacterized protein n=1 Tax=Chaetomium tenue TaxID=1854479 RepID=A0ACB7P732_9PEZI|nr:hypothetical protein F5144DRAFT_241653 [Chaetomium globosum]